jgi:hypothetical protein
MKKKNMPIGLFLLTTSLSAQEVISTQEDSYSNGTNQIEFTIGETVVETVSDGTNTLTQGFHQTQLAITSLVDLDINFSVNIFPNPISEYLNLGVETYEELSFHLFELTGKLLNEALITTKETTVNLSQSPKGTYLLTLKHQGSKKIKTYKIIKKQKIYE